MKMKISRLGISPKVLEEKNVSFYYDEREKSTTVTVTYRIQYPYYFYSESTQKKIRKYILSLSSTITQSNCGVEGYVTFMTEFKTSTQTSAQMAVGTSANETFQNGSRVN